MSKCKCKHEKTCNDTMAYPGNCNEYEPLEEQKANEAIDDLEPMQLLISEDFSNEMDFTYLSQPPKKWTFEQPKLKRWVEKWCIGKTLNLFAGKTRMKINEYRTDISNDYNPDWVGDCFEFVTTTDMKFDTIIFDPPYNLRKSREKYGDGKYIGSLTKLKNELSKILTTNGRIIHFGYDSVGMGKTRGYKKIAICLVCHNGDHNDTICLVDEKISCT